jgi:hypothetical protein
MLALAVLWAACESDVSPGPELELEVEAAARTVGLGGGSLTRDHIDGDVYHHGFEVRVGDGPNATLAIHRVVRERAPWLPRRTSGAILLMHGDFATFATNFAPTLGDPPSTTTGMATWLAERGIDVWGLDRRWTQAPAVGADLSDFDDMGIDQELDDIGTALAFARAIRLVTDASLDQIVLSGFSRGGQLAYFYASDEATRPSWQRHVKALVPLDVYASLSPEDEEIRQFYCGNAAVEYDLLAAGEVDVPNGLQIDTGRFALEAPDDPSPIPLWEGFTNREAMLFLVGKTHFFFPASPVYHLNAPELDGSFPIGLRESPEDVVATWLAGSAPHQSMRESADTDHLVCGDAPFPADVPLSRIRVPLLLVAAAGGYGDHALYSTTQVSSTDVTALVIRRLPVEREAEDFGHADLLFSPDAPALAWQPLLSWLRRH